MVALRNSDPVGYIILRIAKKTRFQLGYLVDFLVEKKSYSILVALIEEAIKYLKQKGAVAILCHATKHSYRHLFQQLGFYPWYFNIPGYFHPRVASTELNLQFLRDPQQWYLTMGDGDLEMSF